MFWNVYKNYFLSIFIILGTAEISWAGAVITYHGRILDSANRPVESSNVTFRIRVYSPNPGKCLLYEEARTVSMAGTNGVFVIPIGDGVGSRTSIDPGIVLEKIFSNDNTLVFNTSNTPKIVCNSGSSYTPDPLHQRQLAVFFDDHSGTGEQNLPLMDISFVPLAVNAYDAQNVGGVPAGSLLRVSGGSASALTPANFTELLSLLNGSSTQYEKVGKLNGTTLPTLSNGQVLGWSSGSWAAITPMTSYTETDPSVKSFAKANLPACGANQFLRNDGSGNLVCATPSGGGGSGTVTSLAAGTGLLTDQSGNAAVTSSGTLSVNVGTAANQIVQMGSDTKLPAVDGSKLTNVAAATAVTASGLTSTASINTSGNITTSGTLTAGNSSNTNVYTDNLYVRSPAAGGNSIRLTGPTTAISASYVLKLPEGLPASGTTKVLVSDDAGNLSWSAQSAGSVTSVTGQAPIVIDSSSASAPKVTLPKATASVDGYLDKGDFAIFSGKQNAGNFVVTLQGDVASSNYSAGTVDVAVNKIKGVAVSAAPTLNGQVLRYSTGTSNLVPAFISMQDLRSNVTGSLALSSSCGTNKTLTFNSATDSLKCEDISITKSQISDLGTLGSLAAKNSVSLTADVSGVLPAANGGTNSSATLNNNRIMASSGGAIVEAAAITASRALVSDASGIPTASTVTGSELAYLSGVSSNVQSQLNSKASSSSLSGYALLAGRSGGQTLDGGTAASESLTLDSTAATTKGYVLLNPTSGNVGVGTTAPLSVLQVNGTAADGSFGPANGIMATGGSWPNNVSNIYLAYGGKYSANSIMGAQFGVLGVNVTYNATTDTLERKGTDSSRDSAMAITMNPYSSQTGGYRMGFWTGNGANPTERLSITGDGKVGVGTTAPTNDFELNKTGTAILGVYGGDTAQKGVNIGSGPANRWSWYQESAANGRSLNLYRDQSGISAGSSTVMTILHNGNVGIATGSPSAPLTVASTGDGNISARFLSGSNAFLDIKPMASGGQFQAVIDTSLNNRHLILSTGSGYVGIGNMNPSYNLDVTGSARFTGGYTTSDARYKRNIASLENSLQEILKLRGVSYDFRVDEYPKWKFTSKHQVGLIAQEIEKVYPEVVETDKEGFKSVNYQALVAPIIEAIKELYGKYLDQEKELQEQKQRLHAQDQKMQDLERRLQRFENQVGK